MIKLSIEEKAKRYDEALGKARRYYDEYKTRDNILYIEDMEDMFPELKESDDEKIRKELIFYLRYQYSINENFEDIGKWIDWLEKQGEHSNFLSKIQVGDKVTRNEDGVLVNLSQLQRVAKPAENTEKQGEQKLAKQQHSYELEEEIEEWLGCEAFPEGTNITPLPKAMEIVRKTANHFYDFGRKQQAIRNIQCTNSQVITPESYINEGQKKGIQMVLDNPKEYGLQKPADKVEPKFKVGDWIVCCDYEPEQIIGIRTNVYEMSNGDIRPFYIIDNNHNIRIWTIEDAKDGDILCSNQIIVLFKQWEDNTDYSFVIAHAGIDISGKLQITNGHWLISNEAKLATKEQRELLFQKMHDAGYEWDAKKKELKKIEQKPAWSEDDEKMIRGLIVICDEWTTRHSFYPIENCEIEKLKNWLKSLKDRHTWKPSDEQIKTCKEVYADILSAKGFDLGTVNSELNRLEEELKKLREEQL